MTYKTEKWKKTLWKGTQRETITTKNILVFRDKNGHFVKGKPKIEEIKTRTFGTGVYQVGYYKGKIKTRKLMYSRETPEHREAIKTVKKNAQIYRCELCFNDIPFRKGSTNEYYGFRITAFSRSLKQLNFIYPNKMKTALLDFASECLRYNKDLLCWGGFNYLGRTKPELSNARLTDSGTYTIQWTVRNSGNVKREKRGVITQL